MSNTWCEQQFEYYLVQGKQRIIPEMKVGQKIHKDLEREYHRTIVVKPVTPEDRWGLKLLNIIHGLKILRETGQTRELPVFAYVKGVFVRGIIDELSYKKPMEMVCERAKGKVAVLILVVEEAHLKSKGQRRTIIQRIVPTASRFRGTELQLMLYHLILATMASSQLNVIRRGQLAQHLIRLARICSQGYLISKASTPLHAFVITFLHNWLLTLTSLTQKWDREPAAHRVSHRQCASMYSLNSLATRTYSPTPLYTHSSYMVL